MPLEIILRYEDVHGKHYEVAQRHSIHVVQQGAERGAITPPELRVGDQGPPVRPAILGKEEIDQQFTLLKTYRRRLAVQLEQQARLGAAHAPPGIALDIDEARAEIRRLKGILRRAGSEVEDSPNDEP